MKVNSSGLSIIKECEGFRSKAYLCPSGVPTIGWGRTKGVSLGMICTLSEAQAWLEEDVAYVVKVIKFSVKVPLSENQLSSLVSFIYNVGVTNFLSSTLLKVLNQGQYSLVPAQMRRWIYGRDKRTGTKISLPGLVKRRELEVSLWGKP